MIGGKHNMAEKNYSTWLVGSLQVLAMGIVMLPSVAYPQTIGATAHSTPPAAVSEDEIKVLRQQVLALAARVKELEKKADQADSPEEGKQGKGIEQRLEALDQGQAKLNSEVRSLQREEAAGAGSGGSQAAGQIVAPFTVVDSAGKPLMRVTEEGHGFSRGIYVYDNKTLIAGHLGASGDGSGRVYVTKNGELPMALMAVGSEGGIFQLSAGAKKSVVIDKSYIVFYTDGGSPLSLFGTKNRGKGYMELNDSGGSKMVEAGMLNSGVGYVMTNPARSSVGINGNPSVLMGGAGR
jgi:hypothetical protein